MFLASEITTMAQYTLRPSTRETRIGNCGKSPLVDKKGKGPLTVKMNSQSFAQRRRHSFRATISTWGYWEAGQVPAPDFKHS